MIIIIGVTDTIKAPKGGTVNQTETIITKLQHIGDILNRKEDDQHRMEKEKFKERFRELYDVSGCPSITQFAKQLEMNRQSVDRYYNGERCPDAPALAQICEKMKVSADWLLGLSDVKSTSADINTVVKTLGLSEKAIETIVDLYGMERSEALSKLLEHGEFLILVLDYLDYHRCLGYITSETLSDTRPTEIHEDGSLTIRPYEAARLHGNQVVMDMDIIVNADWRNHFDAISNDTKA